VSMTPETDTDPDPEVIDGQGVLYVWDDALSGYVVSVGESDETHIVIPAEISGYPVVAIADEAFLDFVVLESIDMSACEFLVYIGVSAFEGCVSLGEVSLPEGLETIRDRAFAGCVALSEIELPLGLLELGDEAFLGCIGLESVAVLEDGGRHEWRPYDSDGDHIWSPYENIYRDTTLGAGIFEGCVALVSVELPPNFTVITDRMFYGCSSLAGFAISEDVTHIGANAFTGCGSLTGIELPAGIEEIDAGAFSDCISLETVTIPNRQRDGVIYRDVVLGESIFEGCVSLASVELPDSFTAIGERMFYGCSSLVTIELSSNIESIGAYAFANCSTLPEIRIPLSVEYIGSHAFVGCSALTIYAEADNQPIGWDANFNPDNRPIVWHYLPDYDEVAVVAVTHLNSNYPNPFNPSTTISFDVAVSGHVDIEVYNVRGQRVRVLVSGDYGAGSHKVVWNGNDSAGRAVGSGVYFYRMTTGGYTSVKKMVMMK